MAPCTVAGVCSCGVDRWSQGHDDRGTLSLKLPELPPDVLAGRIKPGMVFDLETKLDGIVEAYWFGDRASR